MIANILLPFGILGWGRWIRVVFQGLRGHPRRSKERGRHAFQDPQRNVERQEYHGDDHAVALILFNAVTHKLIKLLNFLLDSRKPIF